ncbi:oxidoreductase [Gibbsiella greigii]|jgi:NAD(P)-dependent dehydrogenase (short-subunit alcohol dehydrogenase family)
MTERKVWFITGCSTGFGYELAHQVLAKGDRAVLTARNIAALHSRFAAYADNAFILPLDVTNEDMIRKAVAEAEAHFGRIDILVNNAGYGYVSAIEEGEDVEIRRQFETNVFGLFSLTRHVLAGMRRRHSGHIINFSSIGGLMAFPAVGYYNATKYAVEGFSEALSLEVAALGIHVTIVEPGRFRTDWAGRSIIESGTIIEEYVNITGKRREQLRASSGTQPGDPSRGATAIIKATEAAQPPLRLPLGTDAYQLILAKLDAMRKDFEKWKELTVSTDFPEK